MAKIEQTIAATDAKVPISFMDCMASAWLQETPRTFQSLAKT
jgi:hypothetical protein